MRRALIVAVALAALILLVCSILLLIFGGQLGEQVADTEKEANYDHDLRWYSYRVDCPVPFTFEARCNPKALHDRRYEVDGPRPRVPAECTERVVHEFFRNLPERALSTIASLDKRERPSRCWSAINYDSKSGGMTTFVEISGYVFRDHPVLVARFPAKHFGVPRSYESFDWLGEDFIECGESDEVTHRVRIDRKGEVDLSCHYVPFPLGGSSLPELEGSFVCGTDFGVTRAFIIDPPMRSPNSPNSCQE